MADTATELPISIEEGVREAVKNVTDRPPSSIEGVAIAYLSLVIMAILPIFFGSFRSVKYLKEQKHWIANNLFGIAFAINGVELLHLNNVVTGCILLCGLFLYDVFWVFGTNVMIMHVFKHAQPALLYLVPACLGTPLALALLRGDINALFK
ncbi:hypothetical protein MSG28_008419 [Choristoneura fumiferana]|uniref:Uncharacterized protein n=1 Tax=Choristoneura fumiferana TaxID=7141 RepID=A0ACC0J6Z8_CHOFU|nr:hypothetical protein MSG28_008419 [Choristoneura fumiferana]